MIVEYFTITSNYKILISSGVVKDINEDGVYVGLPVKKLR